MLQLKSRRHQQLWYKSGHFKSLYSSFSPVNLGHAFNAASALNSDFGALHAEIENSHNLSSLRCN